MNMDNQNLVWELCETYFSILEISMTSELSLDQLCSASKIPSETVEKIVPKNSYDYRKFFLKVLISKIDREVLTELKADIVDDDISSNYDKILEGLSLRFEKYFKYKKPFIIMSQNSKQRIEVFLNVFKENYNFTFNLLTLIEEDKNCGIKALKSLALNVVFIKSLEIFLINENKDLDSVIRHLDKYLSDMQDIGLFIGVIKN